MAYPPTEREHAEERDGKDVMQDCYDAVDRHNRRVGASPLDNDELSGDFDAEALVDELNDLVRKINKLDALDEAPEAIVEMKAAIRHLQRELLTGQMTDDRVQDDLDEVKSVVKALYQARRGDRRSIVRLAKALDRVCDMVRPVRPTSRYGGVAQLAKSVVPQGLAPSEQVRAAQILKSWFGERGGQQVPYTSDLCARRRLNKAITQEEERRWQSYHRLPDRINTQDPTQNAKAEWQNPRELQMLHFLASGGISPLVMPSLVRRS
jgi:hypothetical protein